MITGYVCDYHCGIFKDIDADNVPPAVFVFLDEPEGKALYFRGPFDVPPEA